MNKQQFIERLAEIDGVIWEYSHNHTWLKQHIVDTSNYCHHRYCSYGDYDNSCHVERANVKLLLDDYPSIFTRDTGGHYSVWARIVFDSIPDHSDDYEEIISIFEALEDYPAISDEASSEMEHLMIDEALDNWALSDIHNAIKKDLAEYYGIDPHSAGDLFVWFEDGIEDETFKDIVLRYYRQAEEISNSYPLIEAGGAVYFDLDTVMPAFDIASFDNECREEHDDVKIEPVLDYIFYYFVNLNERGQFHADVRRGGDDGPTVFEIKGYWIFDEKIMKNVDDLQGLWEHLHDLKIVRSSEDLKHGQK